MFANFKIAAFLFALVTVQAGLSEENHNFQGDYESDGFDIGHVGFENNILEHHQEPKYSFNYAVNDPHTGDVKHHSEERLGNVVKGSYSLKEADGSTRLVEYQADKKNGFNAKVHKIAGDNDYEQEAYHY